MLNYTLFTITMFIIYILTLRYIITKEKDLSYCYCINCGNKVSVDNAIKCNKCNCETFYIK